jgi:hypothetical protein
LHTNGGRKKVDEPTPWKRKYVIEKVKIARQKYDATSEPKT